VVSAWQRHRSAPRPGWLGGGLAALGLATLLQSPFVFFFLPRTGIPPVYGMALALARGEEGLGGVLLFGLPLLGLVLLGLAAAMAEPAGRRRGWLVLAATLLAALAAALLSGGMVAGTVWQLDLRRGLDSPGSRVALDRGLGLSLVANGTFAAIGWAVALAGARALRRPGPGRMTPAALGRALAATAGGLAVAAAVFWWLTALPLGETLPRDGASGVPTNHPIVVRLVGELSWSPGICARYEGTEGCLPGRSGGLPGAVLFAPEGGWRARSRVEVRVCCGPWTRSRWFAFTTGDGVSAEVPRGPGPPGAGAWPYPPPPGPGATPSP
jgi:hypothetical protein